MVNDFDFEQQIMDCWGIVEDLKTLTQGTLEMDLSKDTIANITQGMADLYHLKFNLLFDTYERLISESHKISHRVR